jgi:hypothetical protein
MTSLLCYSVAIGLAATATFACGRGGSGQKSTTGDPPRQMSSGAAGTSEGACAHAACGDAFFVDAVPPPSCTSGTACTVALRLVATREFHVNDDYPYRFKADPTKGLQFLGTDAAGKDLFTQPAGDWHKADARTGELTVKFAPESPGAYSVSGTMKLSVCSEANCLLEQRHVSAPIVVK